MLRHHIHRTLVALLVLLAPATLSLPGTGATAHAATLPSQCVYAYPAPNVGATVCTPWK